MENREEELDSNPGTQTPGSMLSATGTINSTPRFLVSVIQPRPSPFTLQPTHILSQHQ